MHIYSGSLTSEEERFLQETLSQFRNKPYTELQELPPYQELEVPTALQPFTAGVYKDLVPRQVRIVIQGSRQMKKVVFLKFDAVKAYGFKKDSNEEVAEVPEKELFEFM